ncbi:MAG: response regulator [Pseudomonadota bacterium]
MSNASGPTANSNRVLIVDDHSPILRALSARCQHAGYSVSTATDTGTAIAAALNTPPKHAILDINMPGLDGFALGERLMEMYPELKITYVTASQDPTLIEQAEDVGAVGFFHKPFDSSTLLAHLEEACV